MIFEGGADPLEEPSMTLLYHDPLFLRHETGRHPENPDRLRAITARLEAAGLPARCQQGLYGPLKPEDLAGTHAAFVYEAARATCDAGGGYLDGDTPVCPESCNVALAAAGACSSAVDAVLAGQDRTALCLVRPPGHHATPTRSMGFCLFNSIALAARHALARGVDRVLIVDWDVHHGNGTQDIFYGDEQVTFFSIHRYGRGFYPGSGAASETGTGKGLGHTLNAPIAHGTSRPDYLGAFRAALEKSAALAKPQLVLLSAGFDAHQLDPIGSLGLEVEDFATLTREVIAVANTYANGRLVSCLEGGYHLDALAQSVQTHLEELLASG
jgi:acetoin utilization deacetylase AcuC-like enzyme